LQAAARIFREARRRKVFRTGALYIVGAWLVMQVADVLFPAFGIPDAAIRALVWAAIAGFPVALVFGWLFEISRDGIRRTLPADGESPDAPRPLTRKDYIILAVFGVVAAGLIVQTAHNVRGVPADLTSATDRDIGSDETERLSNSIAVLPFANISNDRENEYFCDGIAEDILNKLSAVRDLNVIGRTSSFAFKDSDFNAKRISSVLNVRYVLQGSVRKSGDQLRISAQLVDDHGVQVWGESFDRQLRNVFEIQGEIAEAVARIVASRIVQSRPEPSHQPPIEAYQRYLAGRELVHARDGQHAQGELRRAVEIDPEFADAYAELAISHLVSGEPAGEWENPARTAIERATQLSPQLLRAQAAKGLLLQVQESPDPIASERVLREVLEQDPSMSDALLWLHNALGAQHRDAEARPVLERAYLIDPLHPAIVMNLSGQLMNEGEVERAVAIMERQLEQPRPGFIVYLGLRGYYVGSGDLVRAHELARSAILKGPAAAYAPMVFDAAWFGDFAASQGWVDRSRQDFPDFPMTGFMAVHVSTWQGRWDEAMRRLHAFMDEAQIRPGTEDKDFALIAGTLLSRGGEYQTSVALLEPVVNPDEPDEDSSPPVNTTFGLHALAWAYQHTGATDKATWLLVGYLQKCAQAEKSRKYRSGRALEYCAEAHLLLGHDDEALAGLEKAVDAGWREYYLRLHDPYWARLTDDPRYRRLMAKIKADVDRQHAEVAAQDRKDDFAARLEAVRRDRLGAQYRPWPQAGPN